MFFSSIVFPSNKSHQIKVASNVQVALHAVTCTKHTMQLHCSFLSGKLQNHRAHCSRFYEGLFGIHRSEASCLRSTRITTNTQAVPVISSKHGISKLHSQGDVYNNNCCNAIRSSLACSPYLSNTAPLQAISQLFINGEEHFERKERQIRHQPRQWKAQESPKRRDWQRDSKFRSLSTCTSLRRSGKTGKNHLEGAEFVD